MNAKRFNSSTLEEWIKEALQFPANNIFNSNTLNGISAYREEKQQSDGLYYEYHFIRRENGIKKSHISSTYNTLTDSINWRSDGIANKAAPIPPPSCNEVKLGKVCDLIRMKLKDEGNFKLKTIGNHDFEIVPL